MCRTHMSLTNDTYTSTNCKHQTNPDNDTDENTDENTDDMIWVADCGDQIVFQIETNDEEAP